MNDCVSHFVQRANWSLFWYGLPFISDEFFSVENISSSQVFIFLCFFIAFVFFPFFHFVFFEDFAKSYHLHLFCHPPYTAIVVLLWNLCVCGVVFLHCLALSVVLAVSNALCLCWFELQRGGDGPCISRFAANNEDREISFLANTKVMPSVTFRLTTSMIYSSCHYFCSIKLTMKSF